MLETIKQHYSRRDSIFNITREDVKGVFYWYSIFTLGNLAGIPDGFVGTLKIILLGLPLYVWLFHTGEEKEPTPDA